MKVDPASAVLFIPPGLVGFKQQLFERIGKKVGRVVRDDYRTLNTLPDDLVPIVGCTPELRPLIDGWRKRGRRFAYWDRGYARRVFATWLPRARDMEHSYYRWHINAFQMSSIRNVPDDRWKALNTPVGEWQKSGKHIVVAEPSPTYMRFHGIEGWTERTVAELKRYTDRPLLLRTKETGISRDMGRGLDVDLKGAHALVTHGSNAGVEAVIMGYPVFVHPDSAASLVGQTDLAKIETPIYPDREPWIYSLAYSQFSEIELVNGVLWELLE